MKNEVSIKSERLAYWYFRFNGFLTTPNFVVHPEQGREQRTDVDILGVRFPYRAELLENSMVDDKPFTGIKDKPYIIIAEVKSRTCNLNGPWTRQEAENMPRVLGAIGAFKKDSIYEVARKLCEEGIYESSSYYMSLFCVGNKGNTNLRKRYPKVPQITWKDVLKFIFCRFNEYKGQKSAHPQWDSTGKQLWDAFCSCRDQHEFMDRIRIV